MLKVRSLFSTIQMRKKNIFVVTSATFSVAHVDTVKILLPLLILKRMENSLKLKVTNLHRFQNLLIVFKKDYLLSDEMCLLPEQSVKIRSNQYVWKLFK